jgi:hypothetical protein
MWWWSRWSHGNARFGHCCPVRWEAGAFMEMWQLGECCKSIVEAKGCHDFFVVNQYQDFIILCAGALKELSSWTEACECHGHTATWCVWQGRKAPKLAGVFSRFQAGIGLAYRAREVIFRFRCMCAIALAANEIASLSKVGWYFLKQEFTVSQAFRLRLGCIRTSLEYIRDVWWPKVPSFDVWNKWLAK